MNTIHPITLPIPYDEQEVHVYLIEDRYLTLVDTGVNTVESFQVFNKKLTQIGYKIEDIQRVILTHHHPDHVGMLDLFSSNVEIYGHRHNHHWISQDSGFLQWHDDFFNKFGEECGLPRKFIHHLQDISFHLQLSCKRNLTHSLKEGDYIAGFRVIETPGHASSHIALYRESDGILIGGDMILEHITPNPIIEPPMYPNETRPKMLLAYLHSLYKLQSIPIQMVYPGHGKIVTDINKKIGHELLLQQRRAEKVLRIICSQSLHSFDIVQQMYPSLYEKEIGLTLSQVIGQLDYLTDCEKINKDMRDGIYYYRL